ncbi:hypothetical protein NC652_009107 [Populus alba x Populus x berolinensis]|nr:hypothetical protein NC652_009107 [Populus alba x Populus x berolinensis]
MPSTWNTSPRRKESFLDYLNFSCLYFHNFCKEKGEGEYFVCGNSQKRQMYMELMSCLPPSPARLESTFFYMYNSCQLVESIPSVYDGRKWTTIQLPTTSLQLKFSPLCGWPS